MDWLKGYHEDHKSVLLLLAKLEGNVMDLKAGYPAPNAYMEFEEFADVIRNVIIPHFKNEESTVYKQLAESSPGGKAFTDRMLIEHNALYALFEQYFSAVTHRDHALIIEVSGKLDTVLRHHILAEEDELPKLL